MNLDEAYKQLAAQAFADGIPCDDSPNGPLTAWIIQRVSYREGTLFFIVLGVACELADLIAQSEGYANKVDKAYKLAKQTVNARTLAELVDIDGQKLSRKARIDGLLTNGFKPSRVPYHGAGFRQTIFQLAKGRQVFTFTTQAECDYIGEVTKC